MARGTGDCIWAEEKRKEKRKNPISNYYEKTSTIKQFVRDFELPKIFST
jgi:hypothetical protein